MRLIFCYNPSVMLMCVNCGKRPHRITWSRHKKGSSGASEWPLRAQISKRTQKPNLHVFKGKKFCTKCLRLVKSLYTFEPEVVKAAETPVTQA